MEAIKKSEFKSISTFADIALLDKEEMMDGYWHGLQGGTDTGSDKSRAFIHGWRNGRVDAGLAEPDCFQIHLLDDFIELRLRVMH
jgi:hypothetical protein